MAFLSVPGTKFIRSPSSTFPCFPRPARVWTVAVCESARARVCECWVRAQEPLLQFGMRLVVLRRVTARVEQVHMVWLNSREGQFGLNDCGVGYPYRSRTRGLTPDGPSRQNCQHMCRSLGVFDRGCTVCVCRYARTPPSVVIRCLALGLGDFRSSPEFRVCFAPATCG